MVAQGNALVKRRLIVKPSANKCSKLEIDVSGRKAEKSDKRERRGRMCKYATMQVCKLKKVLGEGARGRPVRYET